MFHVLPLVFFVAASSPTPGTYRVTEDRVSLQKEVWGVYCDAAVKKPKAAKGSQLEVTVDDNGEWRAKGSGRRFGTASCEGRNKTLAPESRAKDGAAIVLKCRSKRVTQGTEESTQRVWSTANSLKLKVQARQHFKERGQDCVSILSRTTSAKLIAPAEGAEVASEPEPTPAPEDPCAKPGPVAKVTVSPKVQRAQVGAKAVCYEATAYDANGCTLDGASVAWSLDPPEAGTVNSRGCYTASNAITEEEAIAVLASVSAGGESLEAVATAQVFPASQKKAKKTLKALAKTSRSKKARQVLGEVTRGELVIRPLETEPKELPPLEPEPVPWGVIGGAGALALLATAGGLVLARRRRREDEPTELQAKPVVTPKKGGGLVCPKCEFEFAVGEATHCPFDGTELNALERDARQTMFVPVAGGMVCPKCKTRYPTKARFCGHDRAPLVPDFGQFGEPDESADGEGS